MATIRQRGTKWQVQVRRAGERAVSRSFLLRKNAEAWARQTEVQADKAGLPADPKQLKTMTFGGLIKRYQAEVTVQKRGARVENAVLSRLLLDPICGLTLAELKSEHFARYRDERLKTITPGTLKRQLNPIRNMFEVARIQWGLPIDGNPVAKLRFKGVDRKRDRRLRPGEFGRLMETAAAYRNPLIKGIIQFAIATGMRRGEILSVKWQHVNLPRRTLTVPTSKNGHSRTIPLSLEAKAVLSSRRRDSDTVFPIKGNALQLAWKRIVRRAKIDDLRFHDLRHEAISRFFELGLTTPEVASISGHRDLTMLFRYAHAQNQNIIAKLDYSKRVAA